MKSRPTLQELLLQTSEQPAVFADLPASGLAYLLATESLSKPTLLITADETRAQQVFQDLVAFGHSQAVLVPNDGHSPLSGVSPDPLLVAWRLALRHRLLMGERPPIMVLSAAAACGRWMPQAAFTQATFWCEVGTEVPREVFAASSLACGYQPVNRVADEGTFAVRGSIFDIFPPASPRPLRVDLFGDEIASIKFFDPETQRVFEECPKLAIHPIREVIFAPHSVALAVQRLRQVAEEQDIPSRQVRRICEEIEQHNYFFGIESLWPLFFESTEAVLDTLVTADTRVVFDDGAEVPAAIESFYERAATDRRRTLDSHQPAVAVEYFLGEQTDVHQVLEARAALVCMRLADDRTQKPVGHHLQDWQQLARDMALRRQDTTKGEILDPLEQEIRQRLEKGYRIVLACQSLGHAERLAELLRARRLDMPLRQAKDNLFQQLTERTQVVVAAISHGLLDEARRLAIISDVEIFGAKPKPRLTRRKQPPAEGLSTLRDLQPEDLVVHTDFGVGRYMGLERLILNGVDGDYLHLEYADGDKLYVPVFRLGQLQRYRAAKGVHARLDKLGSNRWERTKQRVKDEVLELAHKMLALQARRQTISNLALRQPDDHFRAFEATFPYEETPDQQKAIDAVLADLTAGKPMDRLICGDVGFGKTEVAVRAAFLSVLSGKQAAVLVPTTVLAEQHGITFRERLVAQGVRVEVLSRFRSSKETQEIVQGLRQGSVDVLIGTHRLLSADVAFKDLGVLVVDEEQRFGVKHKERIKQLKAGIHVLTLSATPIPRTLHMAMVGMRDLSIIQTPPAERTSIHTEVTRFDEDVIAEAIRRELHRGGQVYVVHNRVQSIALMGEQISNLVPEAKVVCAHGQMTSTRLEKIMVDFVQRQFNVLVCTAIIESGIDIPSANTMIVNRADTFGLSQLHQLRGRIGRSRERAHAYLLVPGDQKITREASERLAVLKRFSELGAGFQIASQDLDFRGAGDLLGKSQSGQIAAVGYELFTELLAEAVERAKGEGIRLEVEPEIKLPISALLPEAYVPEPMRRLDYYQKMAMADADDGIFDVYEELRDMYGQPPEEVDHLVEVMVMRRRLMGMGASYLSGDQTETAVKIGLNFLPEAPLDRSALALQLQNGSGRFTLLPSGRLLLTWPTPRQLSSMDFLKTVRQMIAEVPTLASGALP